MVEVTTLKSGCLASLVPLLTSQNMDWVTIDPTDDGWHIQSLSVDKVVMIDVLFDGFDGYAPTGPFVLSMDDFKRIASLSGDVSLNIGPRIVCKAGRMKVTVPTGLRKSDDSARPIPNLPLSTHALFSSEALRGFAKASDVSAPYCVITVGDGVTMTAMDEEMGRGMSYEFDGEECTVLDGGCRSAYGLERVRGLFKALPKDAQVEMALSDDYPVMFHVEVAGWHAKCLIAPCIERD